MVDWDVVLRGCNNGVVGAGRGRSRPGFQPPTSQIPTALLYTYPPRPVISTLFPPSPASLKMSTRPNRRPTPDPPKRVLTRRGPKPKSLAERAKNAIWAPPAHRIERSYARERKLKVLRYWFYALVPDEHHGRVTW